MGPWWKTVLSGDFLFLGVHILCPSSQEQTQLWKKKVYSSDTAATTWNSQILQTLLLFSLILHRTFKIKIAFNQWGAISALPPTAPLADAAFRISTGAKRSGATSGELTQLQKVPGSHDPVSSVWRSHLNESRTAWRLQLQSTTDASYSSFELLSLNSWTQQPECWCWRSGVVDSWVMKSRCVGRCVKQLHHNLQHWLKNNIIIHCLKKGLFQFILELCSSSLPPGIKSPHLESRLDPGHTVRPYQSWNPCLHGKVFFFYLKCSDYQRGGRILGWSRGGWVHDRLIQEGNAATF